LNQDDAELQDNYVDYSGQLNSAMESKNKEKIASLQKKVNETQEKRRELYARFAKRNSKSLVSFYAINMFSMMGGDPLKALELLDGLAPQMQITVTMALMRERLEKEKTVMVGAIAPGFSQADTSGKMLSLKDFQGKYVFIDFWASWCHPCREQNPGIVKLYAKFKDRNFTMISVSLDMKKDNWTKAIRQDKLSWYQVSDLKFWNNEVAKLYLVESVPQNFLIDPQGKIIARNLNEEEADELLGKLL
jgi:thiol-disulfide isomerase/thioredoxin